MSSSRPTSQVVAERLLVILDDRGLSVNMLALQTGIPRPTLDRHLKVTPQHLTLGELEDLAAALGIPFEDLLLGEAQVAA